MKYYEILPTHTETPRNTTRKIANLYIEFNCHFLTLQKKISLLLNRSVDIEHDVHKKLLLAKYVTGYITKLAISNIFVVIYAAVLCYGSRRNI